MSDAPGYVYVLMNRSMPGLVKIGQTTRPPVERAAELSASTGVPTPFELVFDILVPDCVAAERLLHESLEQHGYRLATNREFFEAPIRDVITLMLITRETVERTAIERGESIEELVASVQHEEGQEEVSTALLRDAAEAVVAAGVGSTAVLQRSLRIGYGLATRLVDELEQRRILGPQTNPPTPRPVLVKRRQLDELLR